MKTIIKLTTTSLLGIFAATAHAETKIVTQGRAGYAVVHVDNGQSMARNNPRETNVALVMEKPGQSTARVETMGRAGYRVVPANTQGR
ncbi:MAG: hypothetical protein ABIS50_21965 [Luteolibacter sp.]|uniref:hypothetical protein n=1 Tax=Luteolibacter sp. TaxID=1962973 RepID=UPI003266883B